ncbi:MAG: nickel pincer cofactor biosynthesis protein LarC, partial [Nitrospirae bacterium]|nr:nickel pincer cofactor biosynthesis protein LarC [Nitrospirota bacterium]
MKIAYFDCFSGASGDMILGALVDAGLPLKILQERLAFLSVEGYEVNAYSVKKKGLRATKVDVVIPRGDLPARDFRDLREIIKRSGLSPAEKERGLQIFQRLAESEARVHDCPVEEIHFHELGALDTLVDVMGAVIGFQFLGIEKIVVSPLDVGGGMTESSHGRLPIPGPAAAEMLKGVPIYSSGIDKELVTPTGAAILTTLAQVFGPMPRMHVEIIGYGAGSWDLPEKPNLLRLFIGQEAVTGQVFSGDYSRDQVVLLETNIDDLNPQVYEYVMERLFEAGALDVTLTPMLMKKGRPAHKLSVIGPPEGTDRLLEILFRETTTLGIRIQPVERVILAREEKEVTLSFGKVRVKISRKGNT